MGYLVPLNRSLAGGDLWMAGVDFLTMPDLPMRPTVVLPPDNQIERLVSDLEWNPGMKARRRRRRRMDEDEVIANLVTAYHDYPYAIIDQIDARGMGVS